MRVLVVHNLYQQPGGEDVAVEREAALLRAHGHAVERYTRSNDELANLPWYRKPRAQMRAIWARDAYRDIGRVIAQFRPDVVHVHNTFAVISPAVYYVCRARGVPVVQSLYNPRLMCPSANLYRNRDVCEDCVGKRFAWPGVVHRCYRGSALQTAGVATMVGLHRMLGTWNTHVDRYIVATEFFRRKFIEAGLPEDKLTVKPHFVSPDPGRRHREPGDYGLFIGRLDPEKGVSTMLEAWEMLPEVPLVIRGGGQLEDNVRAAIRGGRLPNTRVVGRLNPDELMDLIKGARFLVWPSEGLYESFGLVAIEAFACGVPVITGRIGVAAELVQDMYSGLHSMAGNPVDLVEKVRWAWSHPDEMAQMGRHARGVFEERYTAERNYEMLAAIYSSARA
jgi:glycosyltransferase involved in cell wall biosynthesis